VRAYWLHVVVAELMPYLDYYVLHCCFSIILIVVVLKLIELGDVEDVLR